MCVCGTVESIFSQGSMFVLLGSQKCPASRGRNFVISKFATILMNIKKKLLGFPTKGTNTCLPQ